MIVWAFGMDQVSGGGWVFLLCLSCFLLFLLVNYLRLRRWKPVVAAALSVELLLDLIFWLVFFPKMDYVNHGIGAAYGLLLCPGLYLLASGLLQRREDP